jgi:signal transduction histidine kinase
MDEKASLTVDLAALARIDVVKTILEVVCRTTGMGFCAVARVTDTAWIACAVRDEINFGLKTGGTLELETTICNEIRQTGKAVAIDHVARDGAFCNHPTPRKYGFESYISVPITLAGGKFFGTLCAIDPKPARVNTPQVLGMFTLFADLIAQHLDAQERMVASEHALVQERKIAHLRDQFTAVLGHDLRNPLGAILSSAEVLNLLRPTDEAMEFVAIIQRSGKRMAELIDNLLDLARGRMGGGFSVHRKPAPTLASTLSQTIQELQIAWPNRSLRQEIDLRQTVSCDVPRIAQVLSNLLANAMTHGDPAEPVWIRAHSGDGELEMAVTNLGPSIPPAIIGELFEPFVRGHADPGKQGLGLGLYIASEIARAHRGTLQATSADGKTRFTLRMPIE